MAGSDFIHVAPENDWSSLATVDPGPPTLTAAVVIPIYNRPDLLDRALAGLAIQSYPRALLSIVVADDGSEADIASVVERHRERAASPPITLVRHDGFGAGLTRNLGASSTEADVLVFIDADCIPDTDLVSAHVEWHHRAANLVVIGSRHHHDTSSLASDDIAGRLVDLRELVFGDTPPDRGRLIPPDFRRVLYRRTADMKRGDEAYRSLVSSNFSIRRDRFEESGGFPADLTTRAARSRGSELKRWGGEDTEFGWRLYASGLFFVPEHRAAVYHQIQEDTWSDAGGRAASRANNEGLIQAKIPHRFYRTSKEGHIYEVPKVSWVIAPTEPGRAEELFDQLLRQRWTDWEALFLDDGAVVTVLGEEMSGDPRFRVVPGGGSIEDQVRRALAGARGEYVAILNGSASLDHRLLARAVRRLDSRPRSSLATAGYRVPTGVGWAEFRRPGDVADLDAAWAGPGGLPPFVLVRRREWAKALRATDELAEAWSIVRTLSTREHEAEALVGLPAAAPPPRPVDHFPPLVSDRSLIAAEVRKTRSPGRLARIAADYAVSRISGRPYQASRRPADPAATSRTVRDTKPHVRYVGWVGKENFGDEMLLRAVAELMPWAEIDTAGDPTDLLLLGGGTLINRSIYLEWLRAKDSPRVERAVFGTGVADPSYWGQTEPASGWVEFLETCGYVGVRGPSSFDLLRGWGYEGRLEIVGDPALAITPPADTPARDPGRVVVSPAWTRGELWGGSDERVYGELATLVAASMAEGRDVVMLSCFPADDRHVFELMRRAGAPDMAYVAAYADPDEALRTLGSSGLVVGERLHAIVLAAACGTPFVGIEYRPKVRDFAASLGREEDVVRSDELGDGRLSAAFDRVVARREVIAGEIDASVADFRARLAGAADEIRRLLGS